MFDKSMKFLFKTVVLVAILAVIAQAQSSADPPKEAQRLTRERRPDLWAAYQEE